jgi:hypothetical protein
MITQCRARPGEAYRRLAGTVRGAARGALFSPSQAASQWLRFNVAHSNNPALMQFLRGTLRAAA